MKAWMKWAWLALALCATPFAAPIDRTVDPAWNDTCATCGRYALDSINFNYVNPIRVNQVGYRTQDSRKMAFFGLDVGKSPAESKFHVLRLDGTEAYSGSLVYLGKFDSLKAHIFIKGYYSSIVPLYSFGDSAAKPQAEQLWKLDFGTLKEEGTFRIALGKDTSHPFEIRTTIYNDVFETALKFFGAQRCGDTKSWFHKACHVKDGSALGTAGSLSGGWHDCGDHGKYGETEGYAATMLSLAYVTMPEKAEDRYGASYADTLPFGNDGYPDLLWEAKVGADYIYKLYVMSKQKGLIAKGDMYHTVGHGPGMDHLFWDVPEKQDAQKLNKGGPNRPVYASIGANVAGMYATSLALVGWAWDPFDPVYAKQLRDAAVEIYDSVLMKNRFKGSTEGCCYNGLGQLQDDPALAATALWFATKDSRFGYDLWQNEKLGKNPGSIYSVGEFAAGLLGNGPINAGGGSNPGYFDHGGWTTDFQQTNQLAVYALGKLILKDTTTAKKYGLTTLQRDSLMFDAMECLKRGVSIGSNGKDNTTYPGINVFQPYHAVFDGGDWGFNRYNMGMVTELLLYWDLEQSTHFWKYMKGKKLFGRAERPEVKSYIDNWSDAVDSSYLQVATDNLNYQLGANPWDVSFIMGVGSKNLQHPHNRAANPEGYNAGGVPYDYKVPKGALMGGCRPGKLLLDYWQDYTVTETCIDFSSQLIFPTQILAKDLPPDTVGPQFKNVTVVQVSDTSALITWQTDELSRDTLFYSLFPNGPVVGTYVASLAKNKSATLTGLVPNTTYYFWFQGMDIYRNVARDDNRGRDYQFKTTDKPTDPPKILDVKVCNVRAEQATVFWWTDVAAPSAVEYAVEGEAFASTKVLVDGDDEGLPGRFHKVTLHGLKPGTAYRFDVISGMARSDSNGLHHRFVTTPAFANYTIRLKAASQTQNPNWAHFYMDVTNNEDRPYVGLELRLYLKATKSVADSIAVRSDYKAIFDGTGTDIGGNRNITFGSLVQVQGVQDCWYLPIVIGDTLPVSGRAVFDMMFYTKKANGQQGDFPFSRLTGSWSMVQHSSPLSFPGIDLTRPWATDQPVEIRDGKYVVTYVKDPYVAAFVDGVHIFGYPPDGTKPRVYRTTDFRFTQPLPSPATSVKQDSLRLVYGGRTWSWPDVVKADWQVDNPTLRAVSPIWSRTDSVLFALDTTAPQGGGSDEFAFWGDRDSSYCSCAWQRYLVTVDTMKVPPRKLTLAWTPTEGVKGWSGRGRLELSVSLLDSTGALLDTSVGVVVSADRSGLVFWSDASGSVAVNLLQLAHGKGSVWVSDATADTAILTASLWLPGSVVQSATTTAQFQTLPPWPLLDSAWTADPACAGVAGEVRVRFSGSLGEGLSVKDVGLELGGQTVPVASDSIVLLPDGRTVRLGLVAGQVLSASAVGSLTVVLHVADQGRDTLVTMTVAVKDRVGPRLLQASILERDGSGQESDTLYLKFSEPVSIAGNPVDVAGLDLDGLQAKDGSGTLWAVSLKPVGKVNADDLLKASSAVKDTAGNAARDCASAVTVQQSWRPIPIAGAVMRSFLDDGMADRVEVRFRRKMRAQDAPDSLLVEWGGGFDAKISAASGWSVAEDSLSLVANVTFPWGMTLGAGSDRSGRIHYFPGGSLLPSTTALVDSVGPVLMSAMLRFGAADGISDTLILKYSETVNAVQRKDAALKRGVLVSGVIDGLPYASELRVLVDSKVLGLRKGDSLSAAPRSVLGVVDGGDVANESSRFWTPLTFGPRPPVFLLEERNKVVQFDKWIFSPTTLPLQPLVRSMDDTSWSTLNGEAVADGDSRRLMGLSLTANECFDGVVIIYDNIGTYVASMHLTELKKACEEGKLPTDQGGRYQVWLAWDGRTEKKEVAVSGVYTLRLVTRRTHGQGKSPNDIELKNQLFRFGWKRK